MTTLNDLSVTSLTIGSYSLPEPTVQTLTGDGAITIKHGIVRLNKGSAIAATISNPVAGTDDYKTLVIASVTAQTHTVTSAEGFGNNTADCIKEGEDRATYGGAIGDCLTIVAYNGAWYVKGLHGITIA
jgi:hypothetical protein